MENRPDKRRIARLFMSECCGVDEVSAQAWALFKNMSYTHIARPLVIQWRKEGLTLGQIKTKSQLSMRQVKGIIYGWNG